MAKERQLMTLKQASEKTGISLHKLYYDKSDPEKMKEHGLKLVKIGSRFLVETCR